MKKGRSKKCTSNSEDSNDDVSIASLCENDEYDDME